MDVLEVLEDWIMNNGKSTTVIHDNGKQFTSTFRNFLENKQIKDKRMPKFYPQMQGKLEAYNKIVKNEFLTIEHISSIEEGKQRYDISVRTYNELREYGGINGLTPSEMFLQKLITPIICNTSKQKSVTHVCN